MVEQGLADRQIWITEYGWATANNKPNLEVGNLKSFEHQATYITEENTRVHDQDVDEHGRPWVCL